MSEKIRTRRRGKRIIAAALGVVLVGGTAWAYWTQGGAGNGASTTATAVTDVVVSQTASSGTLAPGEQVTLAGLLTNPNNTDIKVGTLTAEITSVSDGELADFSIGGNGVAVDAVVKKGTPVEWSGMTLAYANSDVNQDTGKGATVSITYTLTPFVEPPVVVTPSTGTLTFANQILTVAGVAVWPTASGDIAIQPGDLLGYKSVSWAGTNNITLNPHSTVTNGVLSYDSAGGYYNHGPLILKRGAIVFERLPEWNPLP